MSISLQPSLPEFLSLANDHNVVTVWCELVSDLTTPVGAYEVLATGTPSFLFESAEHSDHVGRHSFLGVGAHWTITGRGKEVRIDEAGETREFTTDTDPFRELENLMTRYRVAPQPGLPDFRGGAVGYLGYDAVRWFEPTVPEHQNDALGVPDMVFFLADLLVAFDHRKRRMKVLANALLASGECSEAAYERACQRVRDAVATLAQPTAQTPFPTAFDATKPDAKCNTTQAEYYEMVERAKEYIRAGDIFQMVPSQRFETPFAGRPIDLYRSLRFVNPSPYLFCVRLSPDFALIGSSPEVHVRVTGDLVEIRPIAGTRKRGETDEADAALEADLLADPKERAEHVMLVDLARNDVGRIADYSSVQVTDFMTVERYSHVMHIVSHVSGSLRDGRTAYDVMRATFPAGTVSGSPKVRAMQIINELEKSKRCIYSGAVGYFGFDGNHDSCIALRTVVLKDGVAYVQAGGGVVADSTPDGEYQESVNKATAAILAVERARQIQPARTNPSAP